MQSVKLFQTGLITNLALLFFFFGYHPAKGLENQKDLKHKQDTILFHFSLLFLMEITALNGSTTLQMHWMMFLTEDFMDLTGYQERKTFQRM